MNVKYIENAHYCVEMSRKMSSGEARIKLLEMAQTWCRLAAKSEEATVLWEQGRELGLIPPRSALN